MNYEDRIRERAHRIWEEEGHPEGRHQDHWERACREIGSDQSGTTKSGVTPGSVPASGSTLGAGSPAGTMAGSQSPTGNQTGRRQSASTSSSGLVGAEDVGVGVPDMMGVDDQNVSGSTSDPRANQPTTGRSKLVGS